MGRRARKGVRQDHGRKKTEYKKDKGSDMSADDVTGLKKKVRKEIEGKILAMAIMKRADKKRFGNLQIKLKNDYLLGNNGYPTEVVNVLKLLNNYKPEWSGARVNNHRSPTPPRSGRNNSVSFFQARENTVEFAQGTNNFFHPNVTCHQCNLVGHYKSHCPMCDSKGNKLQRGENTNAEATVQEVKGSRVKSELLLNQHGEAYINPNWILLDSESSEHLFCNDKLVSDVKETTDGEVLRMHSNGGYLDTRLKANFGSIEVWFCKDSLANILSLALITNKFRVTMDSWVDNALVVHISEGHVLKFKRVSEKLYALDASNICMSRLNSAFSFYLLLNKIRGYLKPGMLGRQTKPWCSIGGLTTWRKKSLLES